MPEPADVYPKERNYRLERVKLIRAKQGALRGAREFENDWAVYLEAVGRLAGLFQYELYSSPAIQEYVTRESTDADHAMDPLLDSIARLPERYDAKLDADGQRMIDQFLRAGVPGYFDSLADAKTLVPVLSVEKPEAKQTKAYLGHSRAAARFNLARMSLARRRGDDAEFLRAIKHNFAVSRAAGYEASVLAHALSAAIDCMTLKRVVDEHLAKPLSPETARGVLKLLDQFPGPDWTLSVQGERLRALEDADWVYQTGRLDVLTGDGKSVEESATLALFRAMWVPREVALAEIDALMTPIAGELDPDPSVARESLKRAPTLEDRIARDESYKAKYGVVAIVYPAFERAKRHEMQRRTLRSGVQTVLAIELFKAENHRVPDSIDELAPVFLLDPPVDWFTSLPHKPIRYVKLDPATDPLARSFLVYSVGRDGNDDQGKLDPDNELRGLDGFQRAYEGYDFVINFARQLPDRK
ncbi:MAG: hypothetical protein AABZ53_11595 [Planctomycetota bacterium]